MTGIDPIWMYRVRRIAIRQRRGGEAGLARGYRLGCGRHLDGRLVAQRMARGGSRRGERRWVPAVGGARGESPE